MNITTPKPAIEILHTLMVRWITVIAVIGLLADSLFIYYFGLSTVRKTLNELFIVVLLINIFLYTFSCLNIKNCFWNVERAWNTIILVLLCIGINTLIIDSGNAYVNAMSITWPALTLLVSVLTVSRKYIIPVVIAYSVMFLFAGTISTVYGHSLFHQILELFNAHQYLDVINHYNVKTDGVKITLYTMFVGTTAFCVSLVLKHFMQLVMDDLEKQAKLHRHYARSTDLAADELSKTLDTLNTVAESGKIGLFTYNVKDDLFEDVNTPFRELYELPSDKYQLITLDNVLNKYLDPFVHTSNLNYKKLHNEFLRFADWTTKKENTHRIYHESGDRRSVNVISTAEYNENQELEKIHGSVYDVTKEHDMNEKLRELSENDPLTGIYSRRGFYNAIENYAEQGWVILIDLDYFKAVNDAYGHDAGDILISQVATLLDNKVQQCNGIVSRMGGEEYLIYVPYDIVTGIDNVKKFIFDILISIKNEVFELPDGTEIRNRTASVGAAYKDPSEPIESIITLADRALSHAKETGRDRYVVADKEFMDVMRARGADITVEDIRIGLQLEQFYYVAQPIVTAPHGHIVGFELLLRWNRRGIQISPEYFADKVDRLHLQHQDIIGEKLMNKQREIIEEISKHFPDAYVSYNVSIDRFSVPGGGAEVLKRKKQMLFGILTLDKFVLEISEHAGTSRYDINTIRREMKVVQNSGIRIALDDFGKDSSNINRLQDLPVDIIKFDKSIVDSLSTQYETENGYVPGSGTKTASILAMLAKQLGKKVVVEGIEDAKQSLSFKTFGVNHQQGFYWHRPVEKDTIEKLARLPENLKPDS